MMKKRTIKSVQKSFFDAATNRKDRKELHSYLRKFILAPPYWEGLATKPYNTYKWQKIHFSEKNRRVLNDVEGLYFFVLSPSIANAIFINYLLYIGETDSISRRFGEYLDKIGDPKSSQYQMFTLIDDYPSHLEFYYVEIPGLQTRARKSQEDELLTAFMPPVNNKYPQWVEKLVLDTYKR